MASRKKQSRLEPLHARLGRLLLGILTYIFFSEYWRIRIWLLAILLFLFLVIGALDTKNGVLGITIILVYIVLLCVYKWVEGRKQK